MCYEDQTIEMMDARAEAECGYGEWLAAIDAEECEAAQDPALLEETRRAMVVLGIRLCQPAKRFPQHFEETIEQYHAAVRTLGLPRAGTGRFWSSDGFTADAYDRGGVRWTRYYLGMGWAAV